MVEDIYEKEITEQILELPVLFTAGMRLIDTSDGFFLLLYAKYIIT